MQKAPFTLPVQYITLLKYFLAFLPSVHTHTRTKKKKKMKELDLKVRIEFTSHLYKCLRFRLT